MTPNFSSVMRHSVGECVCNPPLLGDPARVGGDAGTVIQCFDDHRIGRQLILSVGVWTNYFFRQPSPDQAGP